MEKPIFPSKYMRIIKGYEEGTHIESYAIDNAGKDSEISDIYAPFTGIIKKIYQNDANEVWLESIDKVEYPDGTIDYLTIMFAHDNDVSDLFVGKKINKGEIFYSEGTKGNVTRNHCHMECGKGKFQGTGWYKNNAGFYCINNNKKPEECLWIDNTITILNDYGYHWKSVDTNSNNTVKKQIVNTKIVNKVDNSKPIKLKYTCEKDDLYGVFLKKGDILYIE